MKTNIRLSITALVLGSASLLTYQNCAPGALNSKSSQVTNSSSFSDCGGAVCEVPDLNTVAVADSQNVLAGMTSKAGIVTPSAKTTTAFAAQSSKLPENGKVEQITAPMWMAVATLGSEVCNDLIAQESAVNATRRFFSSVDFARGPASVTDVQRNDVIRRLARNFWARNESAQELVLIKSSLDESFQRRDSGRYKKRNALSLHGDDLIDGCTKVLSQSIGF